MPGGYKARVAERGQNLSGGQRQRIALARVFLKNPPILILDEGTSALDNISERKVQQAINAARADRTVILVAHRLTTLLDTDRILVFDDGRVVETGTYDELVDRGGVFAELVHSAGEDSHFLRNRRLPRRTPGRRMIVTWSRTPDRQSSGVIRTLTAIGLLNSRISSRTVSRRFAPSRGKGMEVVMVGPVWC